ncbi:hypothetical protein ACHAXT_008147 [Thalassiosira profunda]
MPHPAPSKTTAKQKEALASLEACLLCQLCNKRMNDPATLISCAHSFCYDCIDEFCEDHWECPVEGCTGGGVANKGQSESYVRKNPVIADVVSSLGKIEKILESGPDNWWKGGKTGAAQPEEEEVVDFQAMMEKVKGKPSSSLDSGDESSATEELAVGKENNGNDAAKGQGGRKTMSIDASLFSSDGSAKVAGGKGATPPEFSCSPISMKASQRGPGSMASTDEETERQTATASQLDRLPLPSAEKEGEEPAGGAQLEVIPANKPSAYKRQRTSSISEPSHPSSLAKGPSPKRNRVSFQQQPRVMLLTPSWTLSNGHSRCLRKCMNDGFIEMMRMSSSDGNNEDEFDSGFDFETNEGRESFLATLSSYRSVNCPPAPLSFYAVSTEKDESFTFGDAIIVPRSFQYYLAVACGLPIVDIEFLSSKASMKRRGTTQHQRYPFPGDEAEQKRGRKGQKDCFVLGASNYTWDAPKKARTAALERQSLWQKEEGPHAQLETLLPGTDLLRDYSVLLVGEFDHPSHSKRAAAKRKQKSSEFGGGYCTRGNISLLLQLCGACLYDLESVATTKLIKKGLTEAQLADIQSLTPTGATQNGLKLNDALQASPMEASRGGVVVVVKDQSEAKLAREFLAQLNTPLQIPVVSSQWVLDSIGEFEALDVSKFAAK